MIYGKLVGVSGLKFYNWESGEAKPRNKRTAAKWLEIRRFGKRETIRRPGPNDPHQPTNQ
jgi:hypothetical protein